jgi:hypothetical protein
MDLAKFRPGEAVAIIAGVPEETEVFLRVWALAGLLTWAILDQRPGMTRKEKRSKIRTTNAKQAGRVTLSYLLHRNLKNFLVQKAASIDQETQDICTLFLKYEGLVVGFKGLSGEDIIDELKRSVVELEYVYSIVDYLCRYKDYDGDAVWFNIETAKDFVRLSIKKDLVKVKRAYGDSKISKIWERYSAAAPYIYGLYPLFSRLIRNLISTQNAVTLLEKLASKQKLLMGLAGRAAYAADILVGKARKVRQRDFRVIPRVRPPIRKFTAEELSIIHSINRKGAIP